VAAVSAAETVAAVCDRRPSGRCSCPGSICVSSATGRIRPGERVGDGASP